MIFGRPIRMRWMMILQKSKEMIDQTKTIRGIPGHESTRFHVIDDDLHHCAESLVNYRTCVSVIRE
jgi:hypothetical protein